MPPCAWPGEDDRHIQSGPERQLIIAVAEGKDEDVLAIGGADLTDQLRRGLLVGGAVRVIDARAITSRCPSRSSTR